MGPKLLSIIVPSYNMESYLPKCLGSLCIDDKDLLEQLDVIVVNDGSHDRTSEIAHEWEAKMPSVIRVLDKDNGNYGSCINAALRIARGHFVKVLDADDTFDSRGFYEYLMFLRDHTDDKIDLILTDNDVVDQEGNRLNHRTFPFEANVPIAIDHYLQTSAYVSMHALTYRMDILRKIRYCQCEGVSYSDTEWVWLPLVGVHDIVYLPVVVYRYLVGREGQTMDPRIRAKSIGMRAQVVFHAMGEMERLRAMASASVKEYFSSTVIVHLQVMYRESIFGLSCYESVFDLREFDSELRERFPKVYDLVSEVHYCWCIPYRFIQGWRARSRFFPLMRWVCRVYSNLAS